ncbi:MULTISPECIES: LysM peptidoglycan-binding domain-containing protein [unclassified Micromonospora]|uniref:LysM peptidoglycan-binding domain-containing protein n=1 Tax=unclassified Micromonospora TaxID=2617518 RepID=UPI001C5FB6D9|nr:LysM peptidoglycan-binding domain-containing protein [Micromonospora sp. RL09-050-HVF-A]MBW4704180.1 LysM peptidoglycan-binding domain-containing protein [Micromonospora sp. RL09-050-HVF-A]
MATPRGSTARRTGQLLTGFGSLVVLVALLVGAPIALLAFAGNPLPDHLPTLTEVGSVLTSRDDGQLFIRALALVGWFGWATFAFSVLVEMGAQITRRQTPRLPGMSRQQRAAAALLGSVALIVAASPAASAAVTLAQPLPAAAGTGVATTLDTSRTGLGAAPSAGLGASAGVTHGAVPGSGLGPVPRTGIEDGKSTAKPMYRVARGDYLGEVAERYLDDFDRYPEVARLNDLRDADRIRPGQLIKLPTEADDTGARRHASGHLVPNTPRKPSPRPPVTTPGGQADPQHQGAPRTPVTPGKPAGPATPKPGKIGPATPQTATPQTAQPPAQPPAERPVGVPPAMAAGASRATPDDAINRPLAVSAVLAVASIVGAQIGAVLGLRRRPVRVTAGRTSAARIAAARMSTNRTAGRTPGRSMGSRASAARDLVTGRHRRD